METLVATVLIVVVFVVASMILNNLFLNTIKSNTREIDAHLNELEYLYSNNTLTLPHQEDFNEWRIAVDTYKDGEIKIVEFEGINNNTSKKITKKLYEAE